jgi:MoxR-like ATPase
MVSPHLLDRFALRLSGGESHNPKQRVAQLRAWLEQSEKERAEDWMEVDAPPLSPEIISCLRQVKHSYPDVLPEVRERVLDYLEITEGYSTRRDLALLRLARANAQLEGVAQVTRDTVDRVAEMIGNSPVRRDSPEWHDLYAGAVQSSQLHLECGDRLTLGKLITRYTQVIFV